VPRDQFAPDRLHRWDGLTYRLVDRSVDPIRWADEFHRSPDTAAVIRITDGYATSSATDGPSRPIADALPARLPLAD
jgi:hypothetical protein